MDGESIWNASPYLTRIVSKYLLQISASFENIANNIMHQGNSNVKSNSNVLALCALKEHKYIRKRTCYYF